ncbi:MAG: hypothetical protein HOP30_11155 [Cyclobacteriaceae bacterium]|nr:hypothetical protein [Cyclobacteriaceae bacterium]
MANTDQVKAIYTLLGKFGLRDEKESLVRYFTNKRTESTREMKPNEAAALIGHLKSMDVTDTGSTKMRNKILSMAHEMGWSSSAKASEDKLKKKIDMEHVNNWCVSRSYLHKPLDEYTYNELPKLVTQFEEVYKSHLKKI